MPSWDSADLLKQFNQLAARPTVDRISDTEKYARLAKAEHRIIGELAAVFPDALYPKGDAPAMTTSDNKIFTFGSDGDGNLLAPLGRAKIYASLSDIPDSPLTEGLDYIWEVTQIRIPNDGTRSGTLYWRGITLPADISDTEPPHLDPAPSRDLIAVEAVRRFALEGNRNPALANEMRIEKLELWGKWTLAWRTAYASGGALTLTGRQIAILGQ